VQVDEARAEFIRLDKDRSGKIDEQELLELMSMVN
jgi:Ca2+-binding EF-hand superfamily protein